MKTEESLRRELFFVCKDCNGMNFDKFLEALGTDGDNWKQLNRCRECQKLYPNSDQIPVCLAYVSASGEKFSPSEVKKSQRLVV